MKLIRWKLFFFLAILPYTGTALEGLRSLDQLSGNIVNDLKQEGRITHFYERGEAPELLRFSSFSSLLEEKIAALDPTIGVEVLYYLPQDQMKSQSDNALFLYNVMHSLSTMEGIEYYSASRDRMRIFIKECWFIDSLEDEDTAIPDPSFKTIPEGDYRFFYQKDSSFGSNTYSVEYSVSEKSILMEIINRSKMIYYYIVPLIDPEDLLMYLEVIDIEEGLLFLGHVGIDMGEVNNLARDKQDSFFNRLQSMYNWFEGQVTE